MPGSLPPARQAIVTCMDPRIQLSKALGHKAENSYVLRNGGGRVTDDVVRGLLLCTRVLGVTQVGVLHHTDCRLHEFSNDELSSITGVDINFMSSSDPTASIMEDVTTLRASGIFGAEVTIWSGIYSLEDHKVSMIVDTVWRGG